MSQVLIFNLFCQLLIFTLTSKAPPYLIPFSLTSCSTPILPLHDAAQLLLLLPRPLLPHHHLLSALHIFNSITPLLIKFSHFTANQAILLALDSADHVHVIDLDIMQGLQAQQNQILPHHRAELLNSTGRRLPEFAAALNIAFQFNPLEGKIGNIKYLSLLGIKSGETVVVVHHYLYDVTGSDVTALQLLAMIRPKLITVLEQDLRHGGSFLGRFVEALHYYSARWATDRRRRVWSATRPSSCEIRNIVAVGGQKRTGEVKVERWGDELMRVGFRPVSLAGNPATQANLLLEMFPWQGYTMMEENGCLKLGWKDLSLLTASAWHPSD
ncbi:hypothetical protein SASPL_121829 [Salvia splendens]|uniref:DELLA protein n=1 Tax=Salvia splendens TaxID=180675 RepID=A0A8X8ZWG1_SALSN|nr:hypothetical protein SASPL_121829 [Salvia splendens]